MRSPKIPKSLRTAAPATVSNPATAPEAEFPDEGPKVRARQVLIMLGSHVTMPGKIMQRMSPRIMSKANGADDL